MKWPRIVASGLSFLGGSYWFCGKVIGFLKLQNDFPEALVRYNCHMSFCFSS